MFSPSRTLTLEGQNFIYNENTHTIVLEITQPFMAAGKVLGWDSKFGSPGFGINQSIFRFIQKTKSKLLIHNLENSKDYWTNYDRLTSFVDQSPCVYTVSGKTLFVFPWKLFVPKVDLLGALN